MQVRTLPVPEIDAALDLFAAVAAEGLWLATEAPVDRREVRGRWKDLLESEEGTLLIADDAGSIIGLAAIVGKLEPELGMLVRADRRRQGVGTALVKACVAWASGRGARRVILHVFPHNVAAIALYENEGFVDRGLVRHCYRRNNGERWNAIRMVKELPAPEPASRPSQRER